MLPITAATVLKDENLEARPWLLEEATDVALNRRSDLKTSRGGIGQQEKVVTETKAQIHISLRAAISTRITPVFSTTISTLPFLACSGRSFPVWIPRPRSPRPG